jgi:hypothetical protein
MTNATLSILARAERLCVLDVFVRRSSNVSDAAVAELMQRACGLRIFAADSTTALTDAAFTHARESHRFNRFDCRTRAV